MLVCFANSTPSAWWGATFSNERSGDPISFVDVSFKRELASVAVNGGIVAVLDFMFNSSRLHFYTSFEDSGDERI